MKNEILYEVTVTVESPNRDGFEDYMTRRHIPDVLATGCFARASFVTDGAGKYRTTYLAAGQAALDRYFSDFASGLRDDFTVHFPAGVSVERQVWHWLKEFNGNAE
ncbi:MAG TPA: DUF4286 family protein [Pyrinomonadaceae bacterium]|nr:DUF4286 family protein [Pyrinomonadaceae bacterium]